MKRASDVNRLFLKRASNLNHLFLSNLTHRRIKQLIGRGEIRSSCRESGNLKSSGMCFPEVKELAVRNRKQSNAGLGWIGPDWAGLGWESIREHGNLQSLNLRI